jgi:hypothetical protein
MKAAWVDLAAQWRANRRLRIASGLAALIAAAHLALSLGEARQADIARYQSDAALLARLEGAAADAGWKARADEAAAALAAAEARLTRVAGAGEAQAEMQARLAGLAASAGLADARVRSEAAIAAEGLPDALEVVARLDASGPVSAADALLLALAAEPALRIERIDLRDGTPAQLQLFVRGHFLLGEARPVETGLPPATGAAP